MSLMSTLRSIFRPNYPTRAEVAEMERQDPELMEMIDAVTGRGAAAKSLRDDNLRRMEDEHVDELLASVGFKLDRAGLAAKTTELHAQYTAIEIEKRLLSQLREDVEADFPSNSAEPEPSWGFFVLPNTPAAPIVGLSRDPRSGPRLTPVFFVTASERENLDQLMLGLFEGTDGQALLFHQCGQPDRPFIFVPLMYHLVDEERFVGAMREHLIRSGSQGVAWFEERCELQIQHDGRSYRAVPGADSALEIVSEAV